MCWWVVYLAELGEIGPLTERTPEQSGGVILDRIGVVQLLPRGPLGRNAAHTARDEPTPRERLLGLVQQHIEAPLHRHGLVLVSRYVPVARVELVPDEVERDDLLAVSGARQLGAERVQVKILEPLRVLDDLLDRRGRANRARLGRRLVVGLERVHGHLARPLVVLRMDARRVEYLRVVGLVVVALLRVGALLVFVDVARDPIHVEFDERDAVDEHDAAELALGDQRAAVGEHRIRGQVLVVERQFRLEIEPLLA